MWSAKYILIIASLIIFRFCLFAQQVNFADLEESINNRNRDTVALHFNNLAQKCLTSEFEASDFERFLQFSHQLSRMGYAELVYSNLEKFSDEEQILVKYSTTYLSDLYNEIGYAYYYGNQFVQSEAAFKKNLALIDIYKDIPKLNFSFSYNFLGLINRKTGNFDLAIDYLEKAKTIRIAVLGEHHPQVGSIYNNISLTFKTKGDYENAMLNLKKAIEIKEAANDPSVYRNYLNMSEQLSKLGNYSAALNYLKRVEAILSEEKDPEKLGSLYFNYGVVYNLLKANREAYDYFQKSLNSYLPVYGANHLKIGELYQNLAIVYDDLGEFEKGKIAIEQSISIYKNNYDSESLKLAALYNNLGLDYQELEDYQNSLNYLKKASSIYQNLEPEISEQFLNTQCNIAETYYLFGQQDSAIYYFRDAIKKLQVLFDSKHPLLAFSYNKLGEIHLEKGEFSEANSLVEKALYSNSIQVNHFFRKTTKCLDPSYFFDSYLLMGKIASAKNLKDDGNETSELHFFQLADSILSVQRNFLFNKNDKIQLAKKSKNLSEAVLESFWLKNKVLSIDELEIAFRYAEKSKNLILLKSITENSGKNYAGIPDSILHKEENLLSKINHFSHRFEIENDSLQRLEIEENLFAWKQQYKTLVKELEKDFPKYYELKFREDVPGINAVQSKLNNEQILLSYFVSENSVFRFTISPTNAQLHKIEKNEFGDLLTGMRKSIEMQLDDIYLEKAHQLYQLLIPKNLNENLNSLIIVPDGGLSVLPFEALLVAPENITSKPESWSYLLKQFEICYSPSAAIWMNTGTRNTVQNSKKSLLAFAPVFENMNTDEANASGLSSNLLGNEYNTNVNDLGLAPLYASKDEVQNIEKMFENNQSDSNVHLFSDAHEENFTKHEFFDFNFIHIATHGFVDKRNPELSGLYFAPVDNAEFDNILYTGEIYNLKLNADLITLSACQTALGKVAEGEGILGFSRAFLYAGAKNLVLSLWKVNDGSTSALMSSFYGNILNDKMDFATALTSAKLNLIEGKQFSHPYYWAPFILIGN